MTLQITGTRSTTKEGTVYKQLKTADKSGSTLNDFDAKGFGAGLYSIEYRNNTLKNITISNGTVDYCNRILNMPYDDAQLDTFTVSNITATKLGFGVSRLKNAKNGLFENITATGDPDQPDDFPDGFATSDLATDNITYRNCHASGFSTVPKADTYTNGDGFAQEEASTNMVYDSCTATSNGDGGFDLKGIAHVINCVSTDNHRNYRCWGTLVYDKCKSVNPRSAHIWVNCGGGRLNAGNLVYNNFEFVGASDCPHIQIDGAFTGMTITFNDPILPAGETLRVVKNGTGSLAKVIINYTKGTTPVSASNTDSTVASLNAQIADLNVHNAELTAQVAHLTAQVNDVTNTATAANASLNAAKTLLAQIATSSATAPGGSADKSKQIANLHALAIKQLS